MPGIGVRLAAPPFVSARPVNTILWLRAIAQRHGIGRALVADLELQVRQHGGLTLMLGSDDETDMTTLRGVGLYPNVWPHVANIGNLRGHPFEFYQKCGFVVIGVVPTPTAWVSRIF